MTGCQPVSASRLLACYSGEFNDTTGKLPVGRVRLAAWPPSRGAASFTRAELDSLRQWQLRGKVDRVGLAAHVILPAITAALATAAGIFFAAERAADLRAACSCIYIGDSAITPDSTDEFLRLSHVIGENGRGQSLRHVIVNLNRFVEIAIRHQVK